LAAARLSVIIGAISHGFGTVYQDHSPFADYLKGHKGPHPAVPFKCKGTIMTKFTRPAPSDVLTALLFRFPFSGPWGKELTEASHKLTCDTANEQGLVWKIWLEHRETGHAGGIYLFEDAAGAERYREKHERRLSALGLTGVTAIALSVNTELSALTMAGGALSQARASKSASRSTVALPC
jgi:hypothetical protein